MKPRVRPSVSIDGVDWPVEGAQVAIVSGERVLLQFRPWPPGWELPGGHCEAGEDLALTAAREVEEETGYRVRIQGVVGVYTWSGLRSTGDVLYLADAIGGRPHRTIESWAARFFARGEMPRTAFPWIRQRVADALDNARGAPPVHRVQPVTLYHVAAFGTAWMSAPLDRWRKLRGGSRG
jgi:8-oxo-dGTP pyrophosphatase MutT (NUDIX family)